MKLRCFYYDDEMVEGEFYAPLLKTAWAEARDLLEARGISGWDKEPDLSWEPDPQKAKEILLREAGNFQLVVLDLLFQDDYGEHNVGAEMAEIVLERTPPETFPLPAVLVLTRADSVDDFTYVRRHLQNLFKRRGPDPGVRRTFGCDYINKQEIRNGDLKITDLATILADILEDAAGIPRLVAVDRLAFDPDSPRMASFTRLTSGSLEETLAHYVEHAAIEELCCSLAKNGYFPHEPLTVQVRAVPPRLVVLDGNRRLAALLRLADPRWAAAFGSAQPTIKQVPARYVAEPSKIRDQFRFQHFYGTMLWDIYARSRYLAACVDQGEPIESLTQSLGDVYGVSRRLLEAYRIIRQAVAGGFVKIDPQFPFERLLTALEHQNVRLHLGLPGSPGEDATPVAADHLPALSQLCSWLFGSPADNAAPVALDDPTAWLSFDAILGNKEARARLESTRSREEALLEVSTPEERILKRLGEMEKLSAAVEDCASLSFDDPSSVLLKLAKIHEVIAGRLAASARKIRSEEHS